MSIGSGGPGDWVRDCESSIERELESWRLMVCCGQYTAKAAVVVFKLNFHLLFLLTLE